MAAIAYVTDDKNVVFREGDILVTDASDAAVRNGETSARVLDRALKRNARLFSLPSLHAKLLTADGVALIGSANLSHSSLTRLHEAAVISDRPELVAQTIQLIDQLCKRAEAIDREFVDRILRIPVERRPFASGRRRPQRVRIRGGRTWLLGLSADAEYPGNEEAVDQVNNEVADNEADPASVGWFWWSGRKSRFIRLARVGDRVVSVYRPKEHDRSARGVRVYRHAIIKRIFRERGSNVATFHYVDPADAEESSMTWKSFRSLAARAGIPIRTVVTQRELSPMLSAALHDLWPR
jgi:hypothetical protein